VKNMPDEPKEIARFGLIMKALMKDDGSPSYTFEFTNESIPIEIVLMHLRAFVNNQERDYFTDFDRRLAKFTKED